MNVTNQFLRYNGQKNMHVKIQDLCTYEMGPTATANIWWARGVRGAGASTGSSTSNPPAARRRST